jgi:predicted Zn finger-like uncharacterized protein
MSLTISCPNCQRTLRVPESLLGQSVKCPSCSETFTAPDHLEEVAPPRPAPPPPPVDDYRDEPRPSRRRSRNEEYDDEDYAPSRNRRPRRDEKPGKVQAIAIMILIGGILATIYGAIWLVYVGIVGLATLGAGLLCCLWPGPYYGLVVGIMSIIKGSRLLGDKAYRESPPQGLGIMMIINIINGDVVNLVLGIIVLIFLSDEEVKDYFNR